MTYTTKETEELENDPLVAEVGELVLESAFMRYLVAKSDEEQQAFMTFVTERAAHDEFIEELIVQYPDFAPILTAEIDALLLKKNISAS